MAHHRVIIITRVGGRWPSCLLGAPVTSLCPWGLLGSCHWGFPRVLKGVGILFGVFLPGPLVGDILRLVFLLPKQFLLQGLLTLNNGGDLTLATAVGVRKKENENERKDERKKKAVAV